MEIDNTPLQVFDGQVLDFLADVSSDLLKSPLVRQYPDLAAFAFYIRRANLLKLRDTLFPRPASRLGRGLCFHIAPGNIPVNFAFSWVFSLLAGNANIVRLPSKPFPQVVALLDVIKRHLALNAQLGIRNQFVRYPRTDAEQTARYCAMADCRMIWGGDKTIAAIKALPTSPRCVDICFADRYSFAIISADAVLAADDAELQRLAESFYNDTWLMDQNACSSPQLICWIPPTDRSVRLLNSAQDRFWSAAESVARSRYRLQDAIAVDKLTLACEEAVTNGSYAALSHTTNLLYREELVSLPADLLSRRGKAGYFFEYTLPALPQAEDSTAESSRFNLEALVPVLSEKVQTITCFGIDSAALRAALISAHCRGIDRIVPIGQAMNIGAIWDGHDLVRELSRIMVRK